MNSTLRALLRQNFFPFAHKAIRELEGRKLGDDPYLRYLARELELFADNETNRKIVNLPPGHGKSLVASVCLTAWMLAHDPSLKVMIVTHAEHLSKTIARNIRSILLSGWFKEVFGPQIEKGHAEVTDFGSTSGGGVFVTSFGGSFTGRRADVIIVDDPHDIGDDLEQIEGTIESFNNVVMSRLNDRKAGRVLIVAHRVHEHDLSAYLLQSKKWRHVVLPLVATRDQVYQMTAGQWHRRTGDILRPDIYGPDEITELRRNCFNPGFEMLYQQDIDAQALPAIRPDHFGSFIPSTLPYGPIVLSVDPGVTDRKRSAYSVIQVWKLASGNYYLLGQFRQQTKYADLRENLRLLRKRCRPVAILIEHTANGPALISDLGGKLGKLLIPVEPDGRSKAARLGRHAEFIIGKRIWLPADAEWRDDFIDEFVHFPNGNFTDQVDATTQFLDHAADFAGLEPRPPAGLAAVVTGAGQTRTMTVSNTHGRERGVAAAVRGNGQPITSNQRRGPVLSVKGEVIY
jgi:predicted phage terminase large subunit-like protein